MKKSTQKLYYKNTSELLDQAALTPDLKVAEKDHTATIADARKKDPAALITTTTISERTSAQDLFANLADHARSRNIASQLSLSTDLFIRSILLTILKRGKTDSARKITTKKTKAEATPMRNAPKKTMTTKLKKLV